jgi:hypothetical protein
MAGKTTLKIGTRFGRLIVVSRVNSQNRSQTRWLCRCDCGNEKEIYAAHLRKGSTVSCGCFARESLVKRMSSHGLTDDIAYRPWIQMRARCNSSVHPSYHAYGARGIRVCERWNDFEAFLSDMGPRPSLNHSLDRENNNGNYEPGNCRWATPKEQQNNRSNTRWITYKDERLPLADWSRRMGLAPKVVYMRIFSYKWSIERALETPVKLNPLS